MTAEELKIGKGYKLILQSLLEKEMDALAVYKNVQGKEGIESIFTVARALSDLELRGLVRVVSRRKMGFLAPVYKITLKGRKLVT